MGVLAIDVQPNLNKNELNHLWVVQQNQDMV